MATYCLEDNKELSCPICFEDYDIQDARRMPKLLLCLHTFCSDCTQKLWKNDRSLECSLCRMIHKDIRLDDIFDNHVIIQHLRRECEERDLELARRMDQEQVQYRNKHLNEDQDLEISQTVEQEQQQDHNRTIDLTTSASDPSVLLQYSDTDFSDVNTTHDTIDMTEEDDDSDESDGCDEGENFERDHGAVDSSPGFIALHPDPRVEDEDTDDNTSDSSTSDDDNSNQEADNHLLEEIAQGSQVFEVEEELEEEENEGEEEEQEDQEGHASEDDNHEEDADSQDYQPVNNVDLVFGHVLAQLNDDSDGSEEEQEIDNILENPPNEEVNPVMGNNDFNSDDNEEENERPFEIFDNEFNLAENDVDDEVEDDEQWYSADDVSSNCWFEQEPMLMEDDDPYEGNDSSADCLSWYILSPGNMLDD